MSVRPNGCVIGSCACLYRREKNEILRLSRECSPRQTPSWYSEQHHVRAQDAPRSDSTRSQGLAFQAFHVVHLHQLLRRQEFQACHWLVAQKHEDCFMNKRERSLLVSCPTCLSPIGTPCSLVYLTEMDPKRAERHAMRRSHTERYVEAAKLHVTVTGRIKSSEEDSPVMMNMPRSENENLHMQPDE